MPIRTPWVRLRDAAATGRDYLAMVSYFRLRGLRALPSFAFHAARVELQLLRTDGLMGHSSGSRPWALEFWSVTVWEDEQALRGFVGAHPHTEVMAAMRPHVARSEFVRWRVVGSELPPDPGDAEARLRRALDSGNATR